MILNCNQEVPLYCKIIYSQFLEIQIHIWKEGIIHYQIPKLVYRTYTTSIQIPNAFVAKMEKAILRFIWK